MFRTTFTLIIGFAVVRLSFQAKSLEFVREIEGHPNECYVAAEDKFYKIGQTGQQSDQCGRVSCGSREYPEGRQLVITYMSCGKVWAKPPCVVETREDLSYPGCCPRPSCPSNT